jgi:hypothetical protein
MSHISLNLPWNLHLQLASKIERLVMPIPLTAKNPNVTVARIYVEVRKKRCL